MTNTKAQSIPMPSTNVLTPAEIAEYKRDMAILDADPRTAGSANRPAWLVKRVLAEHNAR